MLGLGKDMVQHIALLLPARGVGCLGLSCKQLRAWLLGEEAEPLWQRLCAREGLLDKGQNATWRQLYVFGDLDFAKVHAAHSKTHPSSGGVLGRILSTFSRYPVKVNLVVVGLPQSGRSSIITKLKLGEVRDTPSGVSVREVFLYKKIQFAAIETSFHHLRPPFRGVDAIALLVDSVLSSWSAQLETVKSAVHGLRNDGVKRDIPLLVFANKQDLPIASSVAEVTDRLELHTLRNQRWYIQAACATSGDGLYEGIDWLSSVFRQ